VAFSSNPRIRSVVAQALVLGLAIAALAWLVHNVATNLERQGIASGFGFFQRVAGFDIIQHLIPYDEQSTYGRAFVVALLNTLLVATLGVLGATLLGFLLGVARLSPNWLVSRLALVYVEALRNVPLLLQLFFWYFAVLRNLPSARDSLSAFDIVFLNIRGLYVPKPQLAAGAGLWLGLCAATVVLAAALVAWGRRRARQTGQLLPAGRVALALVVLLPVGLYYATGRPLSWELPALTGFNFSGGLSLLPELVALVVALTTYTAAFIAEIVRAGILAVPRGQFEAALALGLTRSQTLRLVVVPQAMRVIVPPLTSQYLNLTKNSSLAAAIAYPDLVLVFAGTVLMQTGQAVEVIAITMGVYLFLSLAISLAMNLYNRRVALAFR
jgi:general L-amino acid transport system permease protein